MSGRGGFIDKISDFNPALGVIYSYSRILWPELINLFPLGVVNLHPGKLPQYRGANGIQWAIINGEKETAVTLHYVDQGIDTGPIIAEVPIQIESEDTALTLREKLCKAAVKLLAVWLPSLIKSRVPSTPQIDIIAKAWPRRKPEDGLIDWLSTDEQIYNLIRALVKPWPGAFYYDGAGRKIVIDHLMSLEEIVELRKEVAE